MGWVWGRRGTKVNTMKEQLGTQLFRPSGKGGTESVGSFQNTPRRFPIPSRLTVIQWKYATVLVWRRLAAGEWHNSTLAFRHHVNGLVFIHHTVGDTGCGWWMGPVAGVPNIRPAFLRPRRYRSKRVFEPVSPTIVRPKEGHNARHAPVQKWRRTGVCRPDATLLPGWRDTRYAQLAWGHRRQVRRDGLMPAGGVTVG